MGEILRFVSISIRNLFFISGTNATVSYWNLSNINGIHSWIDIGQGVFGIIAAIIAIIYGYYNIKLIRKKLKDK